MFWFKMENVDTVTTENGETRSTNYSLAREAGDETHRLLLRQLALAAGGSEGRSSTAPSTDGIGGSRRTPMGPPIAEELDDDELELVASRQDSLRHLMRSPKTDGPEAHRDLHFSDADQSRMRRVSEATKHHGVMRDEKFFDLVSRTSKGKVVMEGYFQFEHEPQSYNVQWRSRLQQKLSHVPK